MTASFQVVDYLCFFCPAESCQRLKFNNNLSEANEVHLVRSVKLDFLVENRQFQFAPERNTTFREFNCQGLLIYRLKETAAELTVYFHSRADDCVGPWVIRNEVLDHFLTYPFWTKSP